MAGLVLNAGFRRLSLTGLEVPLALASLLLTALAADRAGQRAAAGRAGIRDGLALGARRPAWVAVYLPRGPDELLGPAPPAIRHWTERGLLRLWEARHEGLRVRAGGPVDPSGAGWYLVELSPEGTNTLP